jgi:hypothetical protein
MLDGFLWEDWRGEESESQWCQHWLNRLDKLRKKSGLALMAVSSDPSRIHRKTAEKYRLIHSFSSGGNYTVLSD